MKTKRSFAFLAVLLLMACSLTPAVQTATAVPTATEAPTSTPLPTSTPVPAAEPTKAPDTAPIAEDGRFTAADGSFSLIPPAGWVPTEIGTDYPALAGPQVGEFFVNLSFMAEATTLPEGFYSAQYQDMMTQALPDMIVISEEFLTNPEGEDYLRWEVEYILDGTGFHQAYYFFESGGWALMVTYTRPLDNSAENDPLADAAIDTLQFNR